MAAFVRAVRLCKGLPSFSLVGRVSLSARCVLLRQQTCCLTKKMVLSRSLSNHAEAASVMRGSAMPSRDSSDRLMIALETNLHRVGRVSHSHVEAFLQEIRNKGAVTSSQALLALRCLGSSMFDEHPQVRSEVAEAMWKTFEEYGFQFDVTHYNAILRSHLQNKHPFEPSVFLEKMERNKIEPNRVTYQNLIAQYCERGDIEGASQILEYMKKLELPIGEQVFNSLITGHFRANDPESAKGILDIMRTAGLEPSCDTYISLICGYIEKGQVDLVEKILEESEKEGVLVRPYYLLKIIFELAINEQKETIPTVLSKLSTFRTLNQDAIIWVNQLICYGHVDVAYDVFGIMTKPMLRNNEESTLGRFFIRSLVKNQQPVDKMNDYVKIMRTEGWNKDDLAFPTQIAYIYKKPDYALELIGKMKSEDLPIRIHYFWPALCQFAESGNKDGFKKAMKHMFALSDTDGVTATLHEYVIPGMTKLGYTPKEMQQIFQEMDILENDFNCAYFSYLLETKDMVSALDFVQGKPMTPIIGAIRPYLFRQYKKTLDWKSALKIITLCRDLMAHSKLALDFAGDWLAYVIQQKQWEITEAVIDEMKAQNVPVNQHIYKSIERIVIPEAIQPKLDELIVETKEIPLRDRLSEMSTTELEKFVQTTNNKAGKKWLLVRYCATGNVLGAESLKVSLDSEGFLYPAIIVRQLIFLSAVYKKDLKEAKEYLNVLESQYPDYADYTRALLNTAALMISEGQVSDALDELRRYADTHGHYMKEQNMGTNYAYEKDCGLLVTTATKTEDLSVAKQVLQTIFELGFIKPATFELIEALLKGYIERGDADQSLEALDWIITEFKRAPCVDSMLQMFITNEDPEKLQKMIDLVTPIHGELNTLHQLMINLVECGHIKKAKKIVETPGLRAAMIRLKIGCENLIDKNMITEVEQLVEMTKNLFGVDRDEMLFQMIRGYVKTSDFKKAQNVLTQYEEEGISPSGRTLRYLAKVLEGLGQEVNFTVPTVVEEKMKDSLILEDDILKHVKENRMKSAKELLWIMESKGKKVSDSLLIEMAEFLFKVNKHNDLGWVLQQFGNRGDVENLLLFKSKNIDTPNQILNKNLFSAYIVSDRVTELFDLMEKNPNLIPSYVSAKGLATLKEKFPEKLPIFEELTNKCEPSTKQIILWYLWQTYFYENPKCVEASSILERNTEMLMGMSLLGMCRRAVREKRMDVLTELSPIFTRPNTQKFIYGQQLSLHTFNGDLNSCLSLIKMCESLGIPAETLNKVALEQVEKLMTIKKMPIPWKTSAAAASSFSSLSAASSVTSSSSPDSFSSSSSDSSDSDSSDTDKEKEKSR